MQKSFQSFFGIFILGVLLILFNAVSDVVFSRFYLDLTEDKLYTLSQGTKNIIKQVPDVITLKAYLSKADASKYPAIKMYGDRIVNLLKEYQRISDGKIKLELYDPRPDTDEETWAQKFGITPLAISDSEKLYFGLVALNGQGDEELIPVFSLTRQEYLEYDVSRAISSLSQPTKPVVGLLTSLKMKGTDPTLAQLGQPAESEWVFLNQLSKIGQIETLAEDIAEIDPKIKLLLLIHPKKLSQKTLYAIDQFVLRGGNLFVTLDPYCNVDQPDMSMPGGQLAGLTYDRSSNLKELLTNWGVELVENKVVGDINLATKVSAQRGREPQDFVLWLNIQDAQFNSQNLINKNDVTTSELNSLIFPWSGALVRKEQAGINFETLLETTPEAMLYDATDYKIGGGSPDVLLDKYKKGDTSQIIAARVSGKFKSNFTAPPQETNEDGSLKNENKPTSPHLAESVGNSNVVVVADTDFLSDQASVVAQNLFGTKIVSMINDNLTFAANVVENLQGSSDLISLRSRGKFTRPFTKVLAIERAAEERFRNEEKIFQATINSANQRLTQIQGGQEGTDKKEQIFNTALLDEIKTIREQRAEAQERLREVRKNLRLDKERLGQWLFLLNTFAIPFLLIFIVLFLQRKKR